MSIDLKNIAATGRKLDVFNMQLPKPLRVSAD